MCRRTILFLDAYDSFTNNIVSLLTTLLDAEVHVLPIHVPQLDQESPDFRRVFRELLSGYDAVVCGPGPGSPHVDADVGLIQRVWELDDASLAPALGVCLGFQSLVVSCGGTVQRLRQGLHGVVRGIDHVGLQEEDRSGGAADIFDGVSGFGATLYHSLGADIGQRGVAEGDWPTARWTSCRLPDVQPLAWIEEDRGDSRERILMAVRHRTKPFWGLQYHPESVCTEPAGHQAISNWFRAALQWNRDSGRVVARDLGWSAGGALRPSLLVKGRVRSALAAERCGSSWAGSNSPLASFGLGSRYRNKRIRLPAHVEVPDIVEVLQQTRGTDQIILDSASANSPRIGPTVRGRYSIIALEADQALKIEYRVGSRFAEAYLGRSGSHAASSRVSEKIPLEPHQTVWHVLASFFDRRKRTGLEAGAPFCGGFMGFTTYEMGLDGIGVAAENGPRDHDRPDLCFAWITKSIVVDHMRGSLIIQQLQADNSGDQNWVDGMAGQLRESSLWKGSSQLDTRDPGPVQQPTPPLSPPRQSGGAHIQTPCPNEYEQKVRECQDYIADGEAYELCLTDQTRITRPRSSSLAGEVNTGSAQPRLPETPATTTSWQLYRRLRARQPAPFGAYVRLGGATLISSSPERFLAHDGGGRCSMRPMKGTVRKSGAVPDVARAAEVLHVPKEEAENLMIVDLVRHDLHGVCGPGNVAVPFLNHVEEYASVFQMISVVSGQLPQPVVADDGCGRSAGGAHHTGLDVLAASLPPGSMTGAPKKRSCEVLRELEGRRERSLYSGVVGCMDVAGRGDWSVTIRSTFRWDDEVVRQEGDEGAELEVWHIGAGGAVTALSTPRGETEEMFAKLRGPLSIFER